MVILPVDTMVTAAACGLFGGIVRLMIVITKQPSPCVKKGKWIAQFIVSIFIAEIIVYIVEEVPGGKQYGVPLLLLSGYCATELTDVLQKLLLTFARKQKL